MHRLLAPAGLALLAGLALAPSVAHAQQAYGFRLWEQRVGEQSETLFFEGLYVTLEVRRAGVEISGRTRSEICATFQNNAGAEWSGGYRLTDRDASNTHASLRVPAWGETRRCETLNPQTNYTVVLRQDRR